MIERLYYVGFAFSDGNDKRPSVWCLSGWLEPLAQQITRLRPDPDSYRDGASSSKGSREPKQTQPTH